MLNSDLQYPMMENDGNKNSGAVVASDKIDKIRLSILKNCMELTYSRTSHLVWPWSWEYHLNHAPVRLNNCPWFKKHTDLGFVKVIFYLLPW